MTSAERTTTPLKVLGRYALHEQIAAGGMASVHFGRLLGPVGFARTVAIKRLHERLAQDPEFTSMFLDEARLAARIRHPNVVPTLDVVALDGELFLVMEYVQGESLARLYAAARQTGKRVPIPTLTTIMSGALHGLHAAHEATSEAGAPLGIVHRDVSPQNILVGIDGVPRVLDFGVAKAAGRAQTTRDGQLKGKLSYMAPEQLRGKNITRAADVYAAGVVLWEGLTSRRLFKADTEAELVTMLLEGNVAPPSTHAPEISPELDAIVAKALSLEPKDRFATAREMARALEKVAPLVPASEIGEWVEEIAGQTLADRASKIAQIELSSSPDSRADDVTAVGPQSTAASLLRLSTPGEVLAPPASNPALPASSPRVSQPGAPLGAGEQSGVCGFSDVQLPIHGPRRRGLVAFAIACGVLAIIGIVAGAAALSGSRRAAATAPAGSAVTETAVAPPPSAEPPAPSPPPSAGSAEAPAPSASPPAPADTTPRPPSAPTPPRPPAAKPPVAPPEPPAPSPEPPAPSPEPPAPSCNPPYVVDAAGNRKYKRECIR